MEDFIHVLGILFAILADFISNLRFVWQKMVVNEIPKNSEE